MLRDFIAVFLPSLIGATVAVALRWRSRPPEQRQRGVAILNIVGIATAMSVSQLVFGVFPELHRGWIRFVIVAFVAVVVYMPFSFVITRLRRRRDDVA